MQKLTPQCKLSIWIQSYPIHISSWLGAQMNLDECIFNQQLTVWLNMHPTNQFERKWKYSFLIVKFKMMFGICMHCLLVLSNWKIVELIKERRNKG